LQYQPYFTALPISKSRDEGASGIIYNHVDLTAMIEIIEKMSGVPNIGHIKKARSHISAGRRLPSLSIQAKNWRHYECQRTAKEGCQHIW
jgi:phosphohistidine swiveling domain-containing protein